MSNTIRYDSLLARQLALELHVLMARQRVQTLRFDRTIQAVFLVLEHGTLRWSLAAGPAWLTTDGAGSGQPLVLPRNARVEAVRALPDERVLRIDLAGASRDNASAALVIELLPPRPNVIALEAAGRVLKVLLSNAGRPHTRGQPYAPPVSLGRSGVAAPLTLDAWLSMLQDLPVGERVRSAIARVAYLSPINAAAVLGDAAVDAHADLRAAHLRYLALLSAPVRPSLVAAGRTRRQPYGHPLWQEDTQSFDSLLAVFAAGASTEPAAPVIQRLEQTLARAQRKHARLSAELAEAAETAKRLRTAADLLLAHAYSVARGTSEIDLVDFEGGTHHLQLDPAMSGAANAQAWYAEARKRDRAAERLPALIEANRQTVAALEDRLQRARAGEAIDLPAPPSKPGQRRVEQKLPYRRYRTSGGLEVRVGRNSRANDELTLRHAAPDDIWMHARAAGGAHVVLRWSDPDANPPRRDLEQAAMLAALHSKARHSGVVPVDWTRRKYVRKPRKAAAGSVSVERVKTLFVRPENDQLNELRWTE